MAYCKKEGKDRIIFATKDDLESPSKSTLTVSEEENSGAILPNGEINWECPCLGNLPYGPCGVEFREMFSCFYNSTAEPKGVDCDEQFSVFLNCMGKHPELYKDNEEEQSKILDNSLSTESDESQSKVALNDQSKDSDSASNR